MYMCVCVRYPGVKKILNSPNSCVPQAIAIPNWTAMDSHGLLIWV